MSTQRKTPYGFPATVADPDIGERVSGEDEREPEEPRIRCPHCNWSPNRHSLWQCVCKHRWNTFDTGGVCPECLFQWTSTQCLKCHVFSAHSAWYTHPSE